MCASPHNFNGIAVFLRKELTDKLKPKPTNNQSLALKLI